MKIVPRLTTLLAAAVLAAGAAACTPTVDLRGNLPHPDVLAEIKPGKTTRDDVQVLLGTPSNVVMYGDETWLYISSRTEKVAFFEPREIDRKIIALVFDRQGKVKAMETKGLEDANPIQTVDRETPTAGKDVSLLQQLLGNVGRFSKDPGGQ